MRFQFLEQCSALIKTLLPLQWDDVLIRFEMLEDWFMFWICQASNRKIQFAKHHPYCKHFLSWNEIGFLLSIVFVICCFSLPWFPFWISLHTYSTKKEPKYDDCLSKFDWHDLSPIFLAVMLLHNLKVTNRPIKHHLLTIDWYNWADQVLTYDRQMLIWFIVI